MIHIFLCSFDYIQKCKKSTFVTQVRTHHLQHYGPFRPGKVFPQSHYRPNIQTPVNFTARFGLTFRANLRNSPTKVHISFLKWIQQKIICTLKTWTISILIQYISTCSQGNNLLLSSSLSQEMLRWQQKKIIKFISRV